MSFGDVKKILVIGDEKVGKTRLIESFFKRKYTEEYTKTNDLMVFYENDYLFFDINGNHEYIDKIPSIFEKTHCYVLVFDLSNKESLKI